MAERMQTRQSINEAKVEMKKRLRKNGDEKNLSEISHDGIQTRKRFKRSKSTENLSDRSSDVQVQELIGKLNLKSLAVVLDPLTSEKPTKGKNEKYLWTKGSARLGYQFDDEIPGPIPMKMTDFQIYDQDNILVSMDAMDARESEDKRKSEWKNRKFFLCGIAMPIVSDLDSCIVSSGIAVIDIQITKPPWICGFGETDNMGVGVSSEHFDIYLLHPHRLYKGMFGQYREKCYVAKRAIDFFLKNASSTETVYDDLLAYLQDPNCGQKPIDQDKLLEHGKFVCIHLADFDNAGDDDETSILEGKCFEDLCALVGIKLARRRSSTTPKKLIKATATPIVFEVFNRTFFKNVISIALAPGETLDEVKKERPKRLKSSATENVQMEEVVDYSVRSTRSSIDYTNEVYRVGEGVYLPSNFFDSIAKKREYKEEDDGEETLEEGPYDEDRYPERYRNSKKRRRKAAPKPFCIGRIVKRFPDGKRILVRKFYRPTDTCLDKTEAQGKDWNLLYSSDEHVVLDVEQICGRCAIFPKTMIVDEMKLSLEDYFNGGSNRFYFDQMFDSAKGKIVNKMPAGADVDGLAKRKKVVFKSTAYPSISKPLRTMDLFAGCGGLSYGLHQAGVSETLWAVEHDREAAEAFQLSNPRAEVFCGDANLLLRAAIEGKENGKYKLPAKGEVEMIVGGPPCQGYSRLNRFIDSEAAEYKRASIVTFLSYVDYYRPRYVILENVANLFMFDKGAVLQSIKECFGRLGFNVQKMVLQAGSFCIPQTRKRAIIVAAKRGEILPNIPVPTHCFGGKSGGPAPFPMVTVREGISDLVGLSGNGVASYKTGPLTHYQRLARKGSTALVDHVSRPLSHMQQARVNFIPTVRGANWISLPNICVALPDGTQTSSLKYVTVKVFDEKKGKFVRKKRVCPCLDEKSDGVVACVRQKHTLIPWRLAHEGDRKNWVAKYGRIDFDGYCGTMVTFPEPASNQGRVLHPVENRVISVRETARLQGFRDDYKFVGDFQSKYCQIGNAVPPPLAAAIGREILKCLAKNAK